MWVGVNSCHAADFSDQALQYHNLMTSYCNVIVSAAQARSKVGKRETPCTVEMAKTVSCLVTTLIVATQIGIYNALHIVIDLWSPCRLHPSQGQNSISHCMSIFSMHANYMQAGVVTMTTECLDNDNIHRKCIILQECMTLWGESEPTCACVCTVNHSYFIQSFTHDCHQNGTENSATSGHRIPQVRLAGAV